MIEDLSHLSTLAIDSLPFGYIALSPDGTVRKYNRYEADLARKDPKDVLGKNFFREVAPCTQVQDFEGRFREFIAEDNDHGSGSTLSFDFEFHFRHGVQRVRIGFVKSPMDREVIVTVNRIQDLDLALEPTLEHHSLGGSWIDGASQRVVATGVDFWLALDRTHTSVPGVDHRALSHQLGRSWGMAYVQRIEGFIQQQHGRTLREVEIQMALQTLSGALGLLGLGTFEVHLHYRDRGLVVITHFNSPLAAVPVDHDGPRCALIAGIHAGFLEHLSGRAVEGRELRCSAHSGNPHGGQCLFVVGDSARLDRLEHAEAGSTDADLLAALVGTSPPTAPGEPTDGSRHV